MSALCSHTARGFVQGVESTVRSAWAAVQSIAAQMPGRPCNWTETTIRTKMRERHRFLKDRVSAATVMHLRACGKRLQKSISTQGHDSTCTCLMLLVVCPHPQ